MNAFDFIETVSLGSTRSAAFVSNSVDLAQAIFAIDFLIALPYVVARGSVRSERFQCLMRAAPVLLASNGRLHKGVMRKERITEEEILAAIRSQGLGDIDQLGAVILETDGTLSVPPTTALAGPPQLRYVKGPEDV